MICFSVGNAHGTNEWLCCDGYRLGEEAIMLEVAASSDGYYELILNTTLLTISTEDLQSS